MPRVCCGSWQKIWTEIVAMIMSALILISVGCFLLLDWSLKERAHCRLFPVVLQAELFVGTGDLSTNIAALTALHIVRTDRYSFPADEHQAASHDHVEHPASL